MTSRPLPEANFHAIISLHHLQALLHLGRLPHPSTGRAMEPNIAIARRELALLEVLRDRTRGNLEADEAEALAEAIASLIEACDGVAAEDDERIPPPDSKPRRRIVLPGEDDPSTN